MNVLGSTSEHEAPALYGVDKTHTMDTAVHTTRTERRSFKDTTLEAYRSHIQMIQMTIPMKWPSCTHTPVKAHRALLFTPFIPAVFTPKSQSHQRFIQFTLFRILVSCNLISHYQTTALPYYIKHLSNLPLTFLKKIF